MKTSDNYKNNETSNNNQEMSNINAADPQMATNEDLMTMLENEIKENGNPFLGTTAAQVLRSFVRLADATLLHMAREATDDTDEMDNIKALILTRDMLEETRKRRLADKDDCIG